MYTFIANCNSSLIRMEYDHVTEIEYAREQIAKFNRAKIPFILAKHDRSIVGIKPYNNFNEGAHRINISSAPKGIGAAIEREMDAQSKNAESLSSTVAFSLYENEYWCKLMCDYYDSDKQYWMTDIVFFAKQHHTVLHL